jgi:glycerophosphoryl diester phosphodiesterase
VIQVKTKIWAHRGASAYAPENTMEAFILAQKMGADGIELDIHLTKDGHVVVAHDETVDRCSNGSGYIIDKTLQELLELDFSKGMKDYSNVRIPTLEQVLEFVKAYGLYLNIEIKNGTILYEGIEEKTLDLVSGMGLEDKVIYSSFNHYSLTVLKKINPSAPVGLLYGEAMVDPYVYAKHLGADAIHPYFKTLMVPDTIENCKKHGIKIHAWTVDERNDLEWLINEGIDAVITNRPDVAISVRNEF